MNNKDIEVNKTYMLHLNSEEDLRKWNIELLEELGRYEKIVDKYGGVEQLEKYILEISKVLGDVPIDAMKSVIENKDKELETYKKIAEKLAEEVKRDSVFYDSKGISSCDLSEEKYCKCSKHNNGANCKQCIIDWAKREVENGN